MSIWSMRTFHDRITTVISDQGALMSNCISSLPVPRVKLLAAALSVALPAAHAAAGAPTPLLGLLDVNGVRTASADLSKQVRKSSALPRAPMTRSVMSTADAGAGSLREMLSSAVDGDVLDLGGLIGTIRLSGALEATAAVTIKGPGEHLLVLDGGGRDRVIQSAHDLNISDVTITNGLSSPLTTSIGGCINTTGNLTLRHATVTGCQAVNSGPGPALGGGAFVGGTAYIAYSTISNNSVTAANTAIAGGFYANKAEVGFSSITGNSVSQSNGTTSPSQGAVAAGGLGNSSSYVGYSTITGNTASASGGTYTYPTTPPRTIVVLGTTGAVGWGAFSGIVVGSTISGNTATGNGRSIAAGVYFGSSGPSAVYSTAISGNSISGTNQCYGGGLAGAKTLTVLGSAIVGNQNTCVNGTAEGGGLFVYRGNALTLSFSTVSGNSLSASGTGANAAGGGIGVALGAGTATPSATLTDSTISGNVIHSTGTSQGGGLWVNGTLTVDNSTIAFNMAQLGGGIGVVGTTNTLYSSIVANNTATSDSTADDLSSPGAVTIAGTNNLVMAWGSTISFSSPAPLTADPMLQPLAFNGGPTKTHALSVGSPAVDAGAAPVSLTTDQRGYRRVVGAAADIGAYELDTDRIFTDGFNFKLLQ